MRRYLAVIRQAVQSALVYKANFFVSILLALIQLLVFHAFWRAVYAHSAEIRGLSFRGMITYVCLSFVVTNVLSWRVENDIGRGILSGDIVVELFKPLDYQLNVFCQTVGLASVSGLVVSGLTLAAGVVFFDVGAPAGLWAGLAFLPSVALGFVVNFGVSFVTALSFFWTTNWWGVRTSKQWVVNFLSGAYVPLALFPDRLQAIAQVLPFQAIVHTPLSIYLGAIQGRAIWRALGVQLVWAVGLWFAARGLFNLAVRQLTVHGG